MEGHLLQLTAIGFDPWSQVQLLVSTSPPGPGLHRHGVALGLLPPVSTVAVATADFWGTASFPQPVPVGSSGSEVHFQALGSSWGTRVASVVRDVVISPDHAPTPPTIAVDPPDPHPGDGLQAALVAPSSDEDQDPTTYRATWYYLGAEVAETNSLDPHVPARVGAWSVDVVANDGLLDSAPTHVDFAVTSQPPTVSAVALTPPHPRAGEVVTCGYAYSDPEGDPDLSTISWLVDGAQVATGPSFPGTATPGQMLTCEVDPFDGSSAGTPVSQSVRIPGNVLVIVLDDVGADQIGLYGIGPEIAPTPNIDALAADGVMFTRAYADPVCSPTRSLIQTGRYAWRTGVGDGIDPSDNFALSHSEILIPQMLDDGTDGLYANGFVGKWHLGSLLDNYFTHPLTFGYQTYSGAMDGVWEGAYTSDGLAQTYYDWERDDNGTLARSAVYVDDSQADDTIARIAAMSEPWFMELALTNAHRPWNVPPPAEFGGPALGKDTQTQDFHWMIEAADTEIGKILAGIDPAVLANTTVMVLGDNGTLNLVVAPVFDPDRQKHTLYEGGIHVPFIVSGPLVNTPGREIDSLVDMVDIYATVADIAGATVDPDVETDSVSFVPLLEDPGAPPTRTLVYAEMFDPVGFGPYTSDEKTVRDDRWKLIKFDYHEEFYDMQGADIEGTDLLSTGVPLDPEQEAAYLALEASFP